MMIKAVNKMEMYAMKGVNTKFKLGSRNPRQKVYSGSSPFRSLNAQKPLKVLALFAGLPKVFAWFLL